MEIKRLVIILFVFVSTFSFGQDEIDTSGNSRVPPFWIKFGKLQSEVFSWDVIYGNKFYNNDFRNYLPNVESIEIGKEPYYIGVQMASGLITTRMYSFSGAFNVVQMIPISIKLNDTINAKLRGFNVGVPIFGFDALYKYKNIDFLIFSGVNIGRLKIFKKDYINKKNPYFSPKISLMPRVALGKIVLSATAEYDFDVFSTRWKNPIFEKKYSNTLSGFRQSGFSLIFGLGLKFQ